MGVLTCVCTCLKVCAKARIEFGSIPPQHIHAINLFKNSSLKLHPKIQFSHQFSLPHKTFPSSTSCLPQICILPASHMRRAGLARTITLHFSTA